MDRAEPAVPRPDATTGPARDAENAGVTGNRPAGPADRRPPPTRPVAVDTARIVAVGIACWTVALVVVLAVPSLHTGDRDWWPWTCVTGLVLGLLGLAYVLRGRGSAAGARKGEP
jgi:hypothetical protein